MTDHFTSEADDVEWRLDDLGGENPPKILSPPDALHALTEAMLALDLSLAIHGPPDDAQICLMHTGEIMNRIQLIRRRLIQ